MDNEYNHNANRFVYLPFCYGCVYRDEHFCSECVNHDEHFWMKLLCF